MDARVTRQCADAASRPRRSVGRCRRRALRRFALSPLNRRRWENFKAQPARLLVVLDLPGAVRRLAVRRVHRQRQAVPDRLRTASPISRCSSTYPETTFGGDFETAADYRDPYPAEADRREGRHDDLAADPLLLRHPQSRSADAGAVAADLDADRGAVQAGGREEAAARAAATSNTTGSAPTTRAATWWRG